jgi:MFS family permease
LTSDMAPAQAAAVDRAATRGAVSMRWAWIVAVLVLVTSVAAAVNQYKVPSLLPLLMKSFSLDLSAAGWLVSVFSITGVILALPSGLIVHRLGARRTGLAALGLVAVGSFIGSLGLGFWVLVLTRVIEGAGLGLISVSGPALIAEWFPPARRGAPMGLYAIWVPLGAVISFNIVPVLLGANGWGLAWVGGGAIALAGFAAYYFVARSPAAVTEEADDENVPGIRALFANRDIWLLSASFACSSFAMGVVPNFYVTFLVQERGWTLDAGAGMTGLRMAAFLISCPVAGLIADRIGSWRLVYTIPVIITTFAWPFLFTVDSWQIPALLVVTGLLGGAFPTASFGAVPEVMRSPKLVGVGMAILTMGLAVANVVAPIVFGALVEAVGWVAAGWVLVPVTIVGIVLGWMVRVR